MKKLTTLTIALVALVAFAAMPVFAGSSCSAGAEKTSASCSAGTAVKTAAKGENCDINECAAKAMNMSKEDFVKMCAEGKMAVHTISIEGMTCGGCENSVTTALEKIEGVNKVVAVSHTDKMAIICVDPKNVQTSALTKAITDKGFQAQVVTADSKTTAGADGKSCSKTCTPAEKAACDAGAKKDKDSK